MKSYVRLWQRLTVYPKLVVCFLVIILPVFAVTIGMNAMGAETVRGEITRSMSTTSKQYLNLIATDLNRAIRMQRDYINNEDLIDLAVKSPVLTEIDKTASIVRLQRQLRQFQSDNAFIEDVVLFIPAIGRAIAANDGSVQPIEQDRLDAMKEAARRADAPVVSWRGKLHIGFSYPDGAILSGRKEPLFVLALVLSDAGLREALSQFRFGRSGGAVLAGGKRDWIVAGGEDETMGLQLQSHLSRVEPAPSGSSLPSLRLGGKRYMVAAERDAALDVTLIAYAEESELLGPIKQYRVWFWVLCGLSIVAVAAFSYWIFKWIHQPMKKLVYAFRRVEQGNLEVTVSSPNRDEFGYLFVQFNGMVAEINRLIREVYEKNFRLQAAEYRQLQSQINPHFLYNSLFIIYRMAKLQETDNVMRLSRHLGEYFRFITRDASDEVPLREELTHAKHYVDIQSIRFNNRIQASFEDIPPIADTVKVPRLIVQPIVENVYQHAFRNKLSDGRLRIGLVLETDRLLIEVEDNGARPDDAELERLNARLLASDREMETTGMINVHRRLRIKYGEAGGIGLTPGGLGGLKVIIAIALEGKEAQPGAEHDRGR
ncbi:sensor histidine kinase [Paenibacillus flagellatus]|uniref:HAMP domain-containing protein n=1 Tax=Paenibacillus flagellatus TaxID=2211139 RepID=A0A2V5KC91_9BACL|nr:histidine kinase [Paenibacillus flagellatus]PYI57219.1 hypothetical protein DLM86_01895 [Paenibacillus flagellatus]